MQKFLVYDRLSDINQLVVRSVNITIRAIQLVDSSITFFSFIHSDSVTQSELLITSQASALWGLPETSW